MIVLASTEVLACWTLGALDCILPADAVGSGAVTSPSDLSLWSRTPSRWPVQGAGWGPRSGPGLTSLWVLSAWSPPWQDLEPDGQPGLTLCLLPNPIVLTLGRQRSP